MDYYAGYALGVMHVIRQMRMRKGGEKISLVLRHSYRKPDGQPTSRNLCLGTFSEVTLPNLEAEAGRILRRAGYTDRQREAILAAARARAERNESIPIAVRGKPVAWKDPPA